MVLRTLLILVSMTYMSSQDMKCGRIDTRIPLLMSFSGAFLTLFKGFNKYNAISLIFLIIFLISSLVIKINFFDALLGFFVLVACSSSFYVFIAGLSALALINLFVNLKPDIVRKGDGLAILGLLALDPENILSTRFFYWMILGILVLTVLLLLYLSRSLHLMIGTIVSFILYVTGSIVGYTSIAMILALASIFLSVHGVDEELRQRKIPFIPILMLSYIFALFIQFLRGLN